MGKEDSSSFIALRIKCAHSTDAAITIEGKEAKHFTKVLYVKPHRSARAKTKSTTTSGGDNMLFVANASSYWTTQHLDALFSRYGDVDKVEIGQLQSCRFATVKFDAATPTRKVLKKLKKDGEVDEVSFCSTKPQYSKCTERWAPGRKSRSEIKEEADAYMARFQAEEKAELERQELKAQEVDADGFVTVSYKKSVKRKFVEATEEEKEELAKSKGRNKKKRSEKELKNFYRFQKREAKRDKLAELREKFQQDKEIVERMKKAGKFKPF